MRRIMAALLLVLLSTVIAHADGKTRVFVDSVEYVGPQVTVNDVLYVDAAQFASQTGMVGGAPRRRGGHRTGARRAAGQRHRAVRRWAAVQRQDRGAKRLFSSRSPTWSPRWEALSNPWHNITRCG